MAAEPMCIQTNSPKQFMSCRSSPASDRVRGAPPVPSVATYRFVVRHTADELTSLIHAAAGVRIVVPPPDLSAAREVEMIPSALRKPNGAHATPAHISPTIL